MKVVLPAPLGPIRACSSPVSTIRSTACKASTAAKRRDSLRTSSSTSATCFSEQGGDAARREEHDGEQQQAEPDRPVLREAGKHFFQAQQDDRADDAAVEIADTADDDHDQQGAGLGPLQQVGAGQSGQVGEQRAGEPGQGTTEREADQAVAENRVAERLHARFVFADGLDGPPETRPGKAAEKDDSQRQAAQRGVEQGAVAAQAEGRPASSGQAAADRRRHPRRAPR
jgi:hypothetical protein